MHVCLISVKLNRSGPPLRAQYPSSWSATRTTVLSLPPPLACLHTVHLGTQHADSSTFRAIYTVLRRIAHSSDQDTWEHYGVEPRTYYKSFATFLLHGRAKLHRRQALLCASFRMIRPLTLVCTATSLMRTQPKQTAPRGPRSAQPLHRRLVVDMRSVHVRRTGKLILTSPTSAASRKKPDCSSTSLVSTDPLSRAPRAHLT
jgi:hypothetical protein